MVVSGKTASNRKQVHPPAEPPSSVNQGMDGPKGAKKRSHLNMTGGLPSEKAEPSNKIRTPKNEAHMLVDVKPTIPQGRKSKTAGSLPTASNPGNVDKGPISTASLRSMKFKKRTSDVAERPTDAIGSGSSSHVPASQSKCATIVKKNPEVEDDQKVSVNKGDIIVKKEPDTEVNQVASQNRDVAMVKQEPDTEDHPDFAQMSREQSIIWARAVEADKAGDEVVATALYERFREMDSRRPIPKRELPGLPSRKVAARPPTESKTSPEKAAEPPKLFSPYFHKKIKNLRSHIPLTIFNPKWQKAALAYEEKGRAEDGESSDDEDGFFYHGYPCPNEYLQNFREWTLNHWHFHKTLRDVYKFTIFAEWMLKHKANADAICAEHGFMMALRYDIHVRANTLAFRVIVDGQECVGDISILREGIKKEAYNRSRRYDELGCQDNPYLPGGSKYGYDPITHERNLPEPPPEVEEPKPDYRPRDNRPSSSDRFARNPRYHGRSFDPNYVHPRQRNVRRPSGSSSHT